MTSNNRGGRIEKSAGPILQSIALSDPLRISRGGTQPPALFCPHLAVDSGGVSLRPPAGFIPLNGVPSWFSRPLPFGGSENRPPSIFPSRLIAPFSLIRIHHSSHISGTSCYKHSCGERERWCLRRERLMSLREAASRPFPESQMFRNTPNPILCSRIHGKLNF